MNFYNRRMKKSFRSIVIGITIAEMTIARIVKKNSAGVTCGGFCIE